MDPLYTEKKLFYHRVLHVWENFCHLHKDLYDLSCEEYLTLLASDIDKLEGMIPLKEEIITKINELEIERGELIDQLNKLNLFSNTITRSGELLQAFESMDQQAAMPALRNLNALLIDIIQKIQEQNKKNQMFLNKAMLSLRDLKNGFNGKKSFTTYGSDGMARSLGR